MKPILIIQLHRIGDIVLTYPLFLWLKQVYPHNPIFILGEKAFWQDLKDVFLGVSFFSWENLSFLTKQKFSLIINLSHRKESAFLTRDLQAEKKIGLIATKNNEFYVLGKWQLYKNSLVHNNRHNSFHWAELNSLDVIPYSLLKNTKWKKLPATSPKKIGLFLGASSKDKTPGARFWIELAQKLLFKGYTPFLLGGEKEKALAQQIEQECLLPSQANLTARFALKEFSKSLSYFDLLITPDTGPMHIAVFMGQRVLNLSLGNVSAWDTGPYLPGNFVLRPLISCYPCWECNKNLSCKQKVEPRDILSFLEHYPLLNKHIGIVSRRRGLFYLEHNLPYLSFKEEFRSFWFFYFGYLFGLWPEDRAKRCLNHIFTLRSSLRKVWIQEIAKFLKILKKDIDEEYWKRSVPFFRIFTSYVLLNLQNVNFAPKEIIRSISRLEEMLDWVKKA